MCSLYPLEIGLITEFLKPMDVEVLGNLEDIQKALDLLQSGKNNTKIVLNVL